MDKKEHQKRLAISEIKTEIIELGQLPEVNDNLEQVLKNNLHNNKKNPKEPNCEQNKQTKLDNDPPCRLNTQAQMMQPVFNKLNNFEHHSPSKQNPMNQSTFELNSSPQVPRTFPRHNNVRPPNQCLVFLRQKKWAIIGTIFLVIFSLLILLSVLLTRNTNEACQQLDFNLNSPTPNKTVPNNTNPTLIENFTCEKYLIACSGVSENVKKYVLGNFPNPNEAQSVLQTSKSISLVMSTSLINASRQVYRSAYTNLTRSVECMSYFMPSFFIEIFHNLAKVLFNSTSSLEAYFNLLELSSGMPMKLSPNNQTSRSCKFSLTSNKARLLSEESTPSSNISAPCNTNPTSVLIYIPGIGYSPSSVVSAVQKIRNLTLSAPNATFDADIIVLGMWRKSSSFLNDLTVSYQNSLIYYGLPQQSLMNIELMLQMILNDCRSQKCLPPGVQAQSFKDFLYYYVERSAMSIVMNQSQYQIANHKDFIRQQIAEGKKVTLFAHNQATKYANKIFNLLNTTQKAYVSQVYLVPMMSRTQSTQGIYYINNPDDLVSQFAQRLDTLIVGPQIFSPNVYREKFSLDRTIETNNDLSGYLRVYKSQLTEMIINAKKATIQPSKMLGSGPITVIVTWQNQPYVSLNIYEPNGVKIQSSNKNGMYGTLDGDYIQPTWGIQHYTTNCLLGVGFYQVQLQYPLLSHSSTVLVAVSAGNEFFVQAVMLNSKQKKYICQIQVSQNYAINQYQFNILPA